jgi:UDP-glucose 4-epimerase
VAGRRLPVRYGPPVPEPAQVVADARRIRRELGWTAPRSGLRRIVTDAYAAGALIVRHG